MRDTPTKASIVSNLVNLKSNVDKVHRCPLISVNMNKAEVPFDTESRFQIEYSVENIESPSRDYRDKHFEKRGDNEFFFERPVGLGLMAKMVAKFGEDSLEIRVNRVYHETGRITIDHYFSPGWHLMDFLNIKLLQHNYCLLHSAAFEYNGSGVLLIGLPNTGKTSTTLNFVLNRGAKFLSEDIAVTDGKDVFACPYALSPVNPSYLDGSLKYKINQKLNDIFPLIGHIYQGPLNSVTDVIGSEQLGDRAEVDYVFLLNNGEEYMEQLHQREQSLLLGSNRAEFSYPSNPLLWAAHYLDMIDMEESLSKEADILGELANNSEVYRIGGDVPHFEKKILEIID